MLLHEKTTAVLQMAVATGAGWGISLSDVEMGFRIISLAASTAFSVIIFVRNWKKGNDKKEKNT